MEPTATPVPPRVAPSARGRRPPGRVRPDGELPPFPLGRAAPALARSVGRTGALLTRRRLAQPAGHLGLIIRFGDGTDGVVYRETVARRPPPAAPTVLVVGFRLRRVGREVGHAVFRWESELNTPLFAGFPGFVSKLWLRHDQQGRYRGLYEWDDPDLAVAYVRALWWPLALVSAPDSIRYRVVPGVRRDDALRDPALGRAGAAEPGAWWQVLGTRRPQR